MGTLMPSVYSSLQGDVSFVGKVLFLSAFLKIGHKNFKHKYVISQWTNSQSPTLKRGL